MDTLILEDFRSFAGRHEIPLAPLTVLVGENSSGKSTFLAATRIAWDLGDGLQTVNFNEDPFRLGAYNQLATYRGGSAGRAKFFSIGHETTRRRRGADTLDKIRIEGRFVSAGSQPFMARLSLSSNSYGITINSTPRKESDVSVMTPEGSWDLPQRERPRQVGSVASRRWLDLIIALDPRRQRELFGETPLPLPDAAMTELLNLATAMRYRSNERPYAFAPIRSRPQRTYDPITDVPHPEGQHTPMVLANLLADRKRSGSNLGKTVADFGVESGLFSDIDVHRLGKGSDPFQIVVKLFGPQRNIIDVGYGVSQILPILVEIATCPRDSTFLIQQPEVHLHPRAQAALATLFARFVRERRCRLIVETHSDYFIDRLRMDIRDEKDIVPDDVLLLYFELSKNATKVYPISIDRRGNVADAPPTYRHFFLDEDRRFFGDT